MPTERASQSPQQVYAIALGALLNWCAKAAPLLCKEFPRIARVFAGPVTRSVGEKQKHNACNSCLVFVVECSCLHTSLLCIAGEGRKDPETRIQRQGIFDVLRVFGKRGTAKKGPWSGCKSGNAQIVHIRFVPIVACVVESRGSLRSFEGNARSSGSRL